MAFPLLALLTAGIQGAAALKANDQAKIDHRNAVRDAHDQLRQQRLAELAGRYGSPEAARLQRYNAENSALERASSQPVIQDWMPVVNAGMNAANALYDYADSQPSKPSKPSSPTGEDVPGQNFSAAPNYRPPVDVATWKPVAAPTGNYMRDAASEFERRDQLDPTRNGWWNR